MPVSSTAFDLIGAITTGSFVAVCGFMIRLYTRFVRLEDKVDALAREQKGIRRLVLKSITFNRHAGPEYHPVRYEPTRRL